MAKELWLIENANDYVVGAFTAEKGTGADRIEPLINAMVLAGMKISKHTNYNLLVIDEVLRKRLVALIAELDRDSMGYTEYVMWDSFTKVLEGCA